MGYRHVNAHTIEARWKHVYVTHDMLIDINVKTSIMHKRTKAQRHKLCDCADGLIAPR